MVFQGTVLGPFLWNVFFKDVNAATQSHDCLEEKLADDLTVTKTYEKNANHDTIKKDILEIQTSIHIWGKANRVSFDATKEEFAIIHHQRAEANVSAYSARLLIPSFKWAQQWTSCL